MRKRSEKSMELYERMLEKGYPESFCRLVSLNLNTDYTARRMLGYLSHYGKLPPETVADEMLAILSDRQRFMEKKILEETNASWNEFLNRGFEPDEEEE